MAFDILLRTLLFNMKLFLIKNIRNDLEISIFVQFFFHNLISSRKLLFILIIYVLIFI